MCKGKRLNKDRKQILLQLNVKEIDTYIYILKLVYIIYIQHCEISMQSFKSHAIKLKFFRSCRICYPTVARLCK